METKKIIAATVVGTSVMTLFSYLMSRNQKRNFTEPDVLSEIVAENNSSLSKEESKPIGWGTHYGIGLAFTGVYSQVWEHTPLKPSLASGAALGALSGLMGVLGWTQLFHLHHPTTAAYRKQYYAQLMAAHIVFGMGAAVGYKMMSKDKPKFSTKLKSLL
ncbi:MAG: hypothetical protein JWM14_2242 [Chitinophagaceae bacterium]|nr:hypothetical protein [Chitinophagaceae bacterium]